MLAVVVVHERRLDEVRAWPYLRDLLATRAETRGGEQGFVLDRVLIYDNSTSPCARPADALPGVSYVHDPANGGTAAAYQFACRNACNGGIDWLLLLDQDTSLPPRFFESAASAHARHACRPRALLPWVMHGNAVVSPARVSLSGTIQPLELRHRSVLTRDITGISSGSLLHAATLAALLPLPSSLWLDYVDHWIFLQMRRRALPVSAFDAQLQHELSVSDLATLSARRLVSVLDGEATFVALLGPVARLVYPLRLLARVLRYSRTRPDLAGHLMRWARRRLKAAHD